MDSREQDQMVAGIVFGMDLPAAMPVPDDAVCASCNYSLRTLYTDGVCPECGYPVERSLLQPSDRKLLVHEDRIIEQHEWYRTWRKRLIATAVVVFTVFWLVPVVISAFGRVLLTHGLYEPVTMGGLLLAILLIVAAHGCNVRCQHASYVLDCRSNKESSRPKRNRRAEDRIAGRSRIYERGAGGGTALLIVAVLALMFIFVWRPVTAAQLQPSHAIAWVFVAVLFIEVAWINSGRLAHAHSIRFYRESVAGMAVKSQKSPDGSPS